jgi:hypothetical protein
MRKPLRVFLEWFPNGLRACNARAFYGLFVRFCGDGEIDRNRVADARKELVG